MNNEVKRKRGRPATGETPKRYFRMSDDEYAQVCVAAKDRGEQVSTFIRRALLARAKRNRKSGGRGS